MVQEEQRAENASVHNISCETPGSGKEGRSRETILQFMWALVADSVFIHFSSVTTQKRNKYRILTVMRVQGSKSIYSQVGNPIHTMLTSTSSVSGAQSDWRCTCARGSHGVLSQGSSKVFLRSTCGFTGKPSLWNSRSMYFTWHEGSGSVNEGIGSQTCPCPGTHCCTG